MSKTKQSIGRLIDVYTAGLVETSEFEPRIKRLKERLAKLDAEWHQLAQEIREHDELRLVYSRFEDLADQINQSLTQEIGSNDARFCGLWSNGWKWIMRRSASCARCPHAPLMTAPKGASCNIVGGVGATQSISSTVKHGDSKSVGGERGCVKL
jgi:hypothetical protein